MKKINNWILYFFLFISILPSVYSVPNFIYQTNPGEIGLQISIPNNIYFEYGQNFTIFYHVYNSTGHQVIDADCLFHMYNDSNNEHLYEEYLSKDSTDYFIEIDSNLIKDYGTYSILNDCNNSYAAGFISSEIFINQNGEPYPEDLTPIGITIILPLFLGLIFVVGAVVLESKMWPIKWFLLFLSVVTFYMSSYLSYITILQYYVFDLFSDGVVFNIELISVMLFILLSAVAVYTIYILIQFVYEKNRKEFNYGQK